MRDKGDGGRAFAAQEQERHAVGQDVFDHGEAFAGRRLLRPEARSDGEQGRETDEQSHSSSLETSVSEYQMLFILGKLRSASFVAHRSRASS